MQEETQLIVSQQNTRQGSPEQRPQRAGCAATIGLSGLWALGGTRIRLTVWERQASSRVPAPSCIVDSLLACLSKPPPSRSGGRGAGPRTASRPASAASGSALPPAVGCDGVSHSFRKWGAVREERANINVPPSCQPRPFPSAPSVPSAASSAASPTPRAGRG